MEIEYEGHKVILEVIYSRRKTLAIAIKPDGRVIVRAPSGLREKSIEGIVMGKAPWILRKKKEIEDRYSNHRRGYIDGDLFLYRGKTYPLEIRVDEAVVRAHMQFQNKFVIETPIESKAIYKELLEKFYRKCTKELVQERVSYYQPILGVNPNRIVIKEQRTRWGSCSSLGNLNFNWKLSMAITEALEYVVVHEMSHLMHMNHSKAFWQLVEDTLPDYRVGRNWLKKNGHLLTLD